ncbi:DUF2617 family protein [Nocardiopsis coralliicola]
MRPHSAAVPVPAAGAGPARSGAPAHAAVPFADTAASDLVWTLAAPPAAAVAQAAAVLGGVRLELRVLAASHQVAAESGGTPLIETVACRPGAAGTRPGALPALIDDPARGYRFRCSIAVHRPDVLRDRVARLLTAVEQHPAAVAAVFPGDPAAATALTADAPAPGTVRWSTWHAYPQTGELVRTESHLVFGDRSPARPAPGREWP